MIVDHEKRAAEAQQVLAHPMYREAFEAIQANIVAKLAQPGTDPDQVQVLHHSLVALHRVRRYMEQVVMTGQMEEMQKATQERK